MIEQAKNANIPVEVANPSSPSVRLYAFDAPVIAKIASIGQNHFKSIENCSKRILRDLFAQKRTNETRVLSFEGTKEDLDAIEELSGEYDDTFNNIELSYDLRRVLKSFNKEEAKRKTTPKLLNRQLTVQNAV